MFYDHQTQAREAFLDGQCKCLTKWEEGFLLSIFRLREITEKQQDCLDRISDKVARATGKPRWLDLGTRGTGEKMIVRK